MLHRLMTRLAGATAFVFMAGNPFWLSLFEPHLSEPQSCHAQVDDQPATTAPVAVSFVRDIMPIFVRCLDCHGQDVQESNYRLDRRQSALGTGDFGSTPIIPGDADASPLFRYISDRHADTVMPPPGNGNRLTKHEVALIRHWINEGAVWPENTNGNGGIRLATNHWSFQLLVPIDMPPFPQLAGEKNARSAIDRFIEQRLAAAGLRLSPTASRRTLIRRLYLDVHGLLPTPEQVEKFVRNPDENAWSQLVDQVLASPRYGERWARHWLDVVRFGESTGYEVNRDRSNAWYYRDYVIEALNSDKSYRDFVKEQLAGDQLGADVATGFLVGGPHDIVKSPDINLTLMQRQDELADYINTTSTAFLGLTVACARCHNHKFDPILQKDYYALQAIFSGLQHGERAIPGRISNDLKQRIADQEKTVATFAAQFVALENEAMQSRPLVERPLLAPVTATGNSDRFDPVSARFVRFVSRRTNGYEPCIDELEIFTPANVNVALATSGGIASSSGDYPSSKKHKLDHINDGIYGNDHSWISNTMGHCWVQIELPQAEIVNRVEWARDREKVFSDRLAYDYSILVSTDGQSWNEVSGSHRRQPFLIDGREAEGSFIARLPAAEAAEANRLWKQLRLARRALAQLNAQVPVAYVGKFGQPEIIHRLYRGEPQQPREVVEPDVPTVFGSIGMTNETDEATRRLKLAEWIVSDENPLTARVIVNRVWQHHFGRGIVATPSDFGVNGLPPSHPQLLDWLAQEFMDNGWSLKWLHRQILLSATYRQSSIPRDNGRSRDTDCRWLWRFPPRRLEAEVIRDCILQVTGKLDLRMGGPGFLLFHVDRENVHHYFPLQQFGPEHFRRMVYMTKIRQEQDDVFGAFDCPDGGQTIPTRTRSTTPLQALNLLNSPFMLQQIEFFADRLRQKHGNNADAQIRTAFRQVFLRDPQPGEFEEARELVVEFGLESFCRALLNANEFLFLE